MSPNPKYFLHTKVRQLSDSREGVIMGCAFEASEIEAGQEVVSGSSFRYLVQWDDPGNDTSTVFENEIELVE
ncbi:MAG: hypothetical protein ACW991_10460 [Candidatus Hodarchaeales archaeon]|jgi:hypothetical protein